MYLLDSDMDRSATPRRTVYRISLTLVKRESLDGSDLPAPKSRKAFRREHSVEVSRAGTLEELREADEAQGGVRRNFRTFSTGHIETGRTRTSRIQRNGLGRVGNSDARSTEAGLNNNLENFEGVAKVCGNMKQEVEVNRNCEVNVKTQEQNVEIPQKVVAQNCQKEAGVCEKVGFANELESGMKVSDRTGSENMTAKKLLKAKSVDDRSPDSTQPNKMAAKASPEEEPSSSKNVLRRSFSFRHWSGGELLKFRALSKEKHHGSSGNIPQKAGFVGAKSRTLEVGAVLNKSDFQSADSKRKTRTLDNSDLLQLEQGSPGFLGFFRGGESRGSERRLVRFFSGIFGRKENQSPVGSPSLSRGARRNRRSESADAPTHGNQFTACSQ